MTHNPFAQFRGAASFFVNEGLDGAKRQCGENPVRVRGGTSGDWVLGSLGRHIE